MTGEQQQRLEQILLIFAALIFGVTTFKILHRPLWLDEYVSWWITSGSLSDVRPNCIVTRDQFPVYYWLLWFNQQVFGNSAFALRGPSVAAIILGALPWCGIVKELSAERPTWAQSSSAAALAFYFSTWSLNVYATNARPYGLLIFLSACSIYALLCWLKRNSLFSFYLYLLCLLLLLGTHLFAALLLPVHGLLFWHYRQNLLTRVTPALLVNTSLMLALAGFAFWPSYRTIFAAAGGLKHQLAFGWSDWLKLLISPQLAWLLSALAFSRLFSGPARNSITWRNAAKFALSWWLIPPLILALGTAAFNLSTNAERYLAVRVLAEPLLSALSWQQLKSVRGKVLVLCLWLLGTCALSPYALYLQPAYEDWHGAVQKIRAEDPAGHCLGLVASGLRGTGVHDTLADNRLHDLYTAPARLGGAVNQFLPLPLSPDFPVEASYLNQIVRPTLNQANCVWILARRAALLIDGQKRYWTRADFEKLLATEQLFLSTPNNFTNVQLYRFDRRN